MSQSLTCFSRVGYPVESLRLVTGGSQEYRLRAGEYGLVALRKFVRVFLNRGKGLGFSLQIK
ncbi:MAG: hypothetical protein EXS36_12025 [Pedosphaera sp.]|nr:hypothetical protein [Pedosphaera sp.]